MMDLISRRDAIDALRDYLVEDVQFGDELTAGYNDGIDMAITTISKLPSAQPERKKGKWLEPAPEGCFSYDAKAYSECSECGKKEFLGWRKNFCPNCGADMRGEKEWQTRKPEQDGYVALCATKINAKEKLMIAMSRYI